MLANPQVGQLVRVHYNKTRAPFMPYHGRYGRVVVVSKGKPRNHGVEIDGKMICIPCGNLNKVQARRNDGVLMDVFACTPNDPIGLRPAKVEGRDDGK